MTILEGFEPGSARLGEQTIAYAKAGSGPPVLLLHGFPQTHAMWHAIAPSLAETHTVIATDLRGYGASSKPSDARDMSFRLMARDQVELMAKLGFERFHLIGHDRGARTAHRLALDTPERLLSLTVMDIVPTHYLLENITQDVARAYYHWFFLAQPSPSPERMIAADPDAYFESCLAGWGSSALGQFDPKALNAYRAAWRDPDCIRTMCHDYRAALDVDFADDAEHIGQAVNVPALVLYGADGAMAKHYDVPETWKNRLTNMQAAALPGGHFFPDTHPAETTRALLSFLKKLK